MRCLFSRSWEIREISLHQLSRIAVGVLLLGVGEGRPGVKISNSTYEATHAMLECCCQVITYTCADPVYKVFVSSLVSMG